MINNLQRALLHRLHNRNPKSLIPRRHLILGIFGRPRRLDRLANSHPRHTVHIPHTQLPPYRRTEHMHKKHTD